MANCLSAGLAPVAALEASRLVQDSQLDRCLKDVIDGCGRGMSIADSLAPHRRRLPHFFLPVLEAGEASGRLVEAFRFLHECCLRINPTLALVRSVWLYPLLIILCGWLARMVIMVYFGSYGTAWQTFLGFGTQLGLLALVIYGVGRVPALARVRDWGALQFPMVREVVIGLSQVLFFGSFSLLLKTGGIEVLRILEYASEAVGNSVVRSDFLNARPVFVQHGSFEAAFNQVRLLDARQKSIIATSAMAGCLEDGLERIVKVAHEDLEVTLNRFNAIFQRLLVFSVSMSIVGTLWMCIPKNAF